MLDKPKPITFKSYLLNGEVQNYSVPVSGFFHQWGSDVIKLDNVWHPITVAIVESGNGQVHNALPETVFFTKY
ncbi:hypothetical protein G7074_18095 [Pedobacter sp. HDW13]|uniref:hypothetical protein n=1 Tax=Pedobacter sp. HDW13 TaxID=2714940 RepID=UPI00140CAE93|nr:hypothetical protein [Pedobacter sp. HDW13]QIL41007.1 hypothetical protein G7074_18095 [Pedobacter sp. HDW13]